MEKDFKSLLILLLLSVLSLFISCSQSFIFTTLAKNYSHPIQKNNDYKSLTEYHQDFLFLIEMLKEAHPNIFEHISEQEFEIEKNQIIERLGNQTEDIEFHLLLSKFLANFKDGHTYLLDSPFNYSKKIYPVRIDWNGEGYYISNIDRALDSTIIGAKVIAVNDRPIEEVAKQLREYQPADNEFSQNWLTANYLMLPEYLKYTGVSDNIDSLKLTVYNAKTAEKNLSIMKKKKKDIKYYKLPSRKNEFIKFLKKPFYYQVIPQHNFAYFRFGSFLDKTAMIDGLKSYAKWYIRPFVRLYINHYCRKKGIERFDDFLKRMFTDLINNKVEYLIIDIRGNVGGDA